MKLYIKPKMETCVHEEELLMTISGGTANDSEQLAPKMHKVSFDDYDLSDDEE